MPPIASDRLIPLLRTLEALDYSFVTPTPATHRRVLASRIEPAASLRDVLGWNLPFTPGILPRSIREALESQALVEIQEGGWRSRVRVSSLHGRLFAHSSFPTDDPDAVFFGPDSYRFADFIEHHLDPRSGLDIIDLGAGAGVGGILAGHIAPGARVVLADSNASALEFARANAVVAEVAVDIHRGDGLSGLGHADLIVANPPYMADPASRTYRDGGGRTGEGLSLAWAREAVDHLRPGGRLLLYTGAAIKDGRDPIRAGLEALKGVSLQYRELDPDVFGEELSKPDYAGVDRIAVVGAVMIKT